MSKARCAPRSNKRIGGCTGSIADPVAREVDHQRGDVTIMVAALMTVVALLVGLIVEAGAMITAKSQADTLAAEASRAASMGMFAQNNADIRGQTEVLNSLEPASQGDSREDPGGESPEGARFVDQSNTVASGDDPVTDEKQQRRDKQVLAARAAVEHYIAQVQAHHPDFQISVTVSPHSASEVNVKVQVARTTLLGNAAHAQGSRIASVHTGISQAQEEQSHQPATPPGPQDPAQPEQTIQPASSGLGNDNHLMDEDPAPPAEGSDAPDSPASPPQVTPEPSSPRPTGTASPSKEPTSKEPTSKEPTGKEPTSKKPTSKKPTSKKPTSKVPTPLSASEKKKASTPSSKATPRSSTVGGTP